MSKKLEATVPSRLNKPKLDSSKNYSTGLIIKQNVVAKVKSFRLRNQDIDDLLKLKKLVNEQENIYKIYNETDIIRGIINYTLNNLDINKLINHIKNVQ